MSMLVNIIQICVYDIYVSTYRDIYIYRERERERQKYIQVYISVYMNLLKCLCIKY